MPSELFAIALSITAVIVGLVLPSVWKRISRHLTCRISPEELTEPFSAKFMLNATCSGSTSELLHLGKVRTDTIKRTSRELLKRYPERFEGNWESDKQTVNELVITQSKRMRNRIAGYVTRLKVVEAEREAATQVAAEAPESDEPEAE